MTVKEYQAKYDISLQEAEDAFWLATECALVWLRVGSRSTATGKSGLPSVGARPRHLTSTTPSRPEVEEAALSDHACAICGCVAGEHGDLHAFRSVA